MGICLVMIVLYLIADGPARQAQPIVAAILFLWWCGSFIVITFRKPFQNACGTDGSSNVGLFTVSYGSSSSTTATSGTANYGSTANGFIATWIAFIAAINYLMS